MKTKKNFNARPNRPARQNRMPSLFRRMTAAEAAQARAVAYEAVLAVIG
jgi:hypothetical protein